MVDDTTLNELRIAIAASPKSLARIAMESRVNRATIRRLLHSAGGLSEGQAQRLARAVGIVITVRVVADDETRFDGPAVAEVTGIDHETQLAN